MKTRPKSEGHAFTAGFLIACAEMVRLHGSEVEAEDVLSGAGYHLADALACGLEEDDLAVLRPRFESIATRQAAEAGRALWRRRSRA